MHINKNIRKTILIIVLVVFILINIILLFDSNKITKNGNNKNIKEIEEKILSIDSYKANIEVIIKTNKNENYYNIDQMVKDNKCNQVIKSPESIKGMEIKYENEKIEIKNTELNVGKIYEDYPNINSNYLFLTDFIQIYNNCKDNQKQIELNKQDENQIIIQCNNVDENNKYNQEYKLYIDKKTFKPEKLEVYDINKNLRAYILYNEIEFNI